MNEIAKLGLLINLHLGLELRQIGRLDLGLNRHLGLGQSKIGRLDLELNQHLGLGQSKIEQLDLVQSQQCVVSTILTGQQGSELKMLSGVHIPLKKVQDYNNKAYTKVWVQWFKVSKSKLRLV